MAYWIFKWLFFVGAFRLVFRARIVGGRHIPEHGPAILVGNHISSGDTVVLPALMTRRLTFPAKAEMFEGSDLRSRFVAWFLKSVGQVPMDRSGGRASAGSMENVLGVLRRGELLGIFPEGTRSVDGRLYKGKTGVARLVLQANVAVIPVGFVRTRWVKTRFGFPWMVDAVVEVGAPMDFSDYAAGATDREVLRWVTDEIMAAVQELSGQTYVDAYGTSVKTALTEGRELNATILARPGDGRPVPPVPTALVPPAPTGIDASDPTVVSDVTT